MTNLETIEQKNVQMYVSWFTVFALSLLIVVQEIPFFHRIAGGYAVFVPFMVLFVFSLLRRRISINRTDVLFYVCLIGYYVIAFLYKFIGISSTGIGHDIHSVAYFVFFFSIYSVVNMDRKQKQFLLWTVLIAMFIVIVLNIYEYRRLGAYYFAIFRNNDDLENSHVIPTQYSAALMLMSGMLFICMLHDKSTNRRIGWTILFIICNVFNLLVMQRAITLILSVAMYALIILFNTRHKAYVSFLTVFVTVFLIIAISNYEVVLSYVAQLFRSDRIAEKMNQIVRFFNSGDIQDAGGSLTARYNLYLRSILTWLKSVRSFFFGAGDHISTNSIIGNHSQFFDVLGQYGIVGGVFLYCAVYRTLKELMRQLPIPLKSPIYYQSAVICLIFVVRGFLGDILMEYVAVRMFIIFPIFLSLIEPKQKANMVSAGSAENK